MEQRLLLDCARLHSEKPFRTSPLPESFDWAYVRRQAGRHGIVPLLHRYLSLHPSMRPPVELFDLIDRQARQLAVSHLFQTRELLRILDRCEQAGIEVIPFKGPVLGYYLFGSLALRTFSDLDLLIHRADYPRVRTILTEDGYRPFRQMPASMEQKFLDTQMGFEFVREDGRTVIEVHWAFLNRIHAFKMKPAEAWLHKQRITIDGRRVFTLSPEHLLVYLCAHGSKSLWTRLRWICDVAELIHRQDQPAFWQRTMDIARESRGERMLNIGLSLAHSLLDAPVPTAVMARVDRDMEARNLARRVMDRLFENEDHEDFSLKQIAFHLTMRERFSDRLPYLWHIARIWLSPSAKDKAFLTLPRKLEFLYVLIKPFRLLRERLGWSHRSP